MGDVVVADKKVACNWRFTGWGAKVQPPAENHDYDGIENDPEYVAALEAEKRALLDNDMPTFLQRKTERTAILRKWSVK